VFLSRFQSNTVLPDRCTIGEHEPANQAVTLELVIELLDRLTLPEPLKEFVTVEFVLVTLKPPATAASSSSFNSTGSNSIFSIWYPFLVAFEMRGRL
jgi:hypothetical protein